MEVDGEASIDAAARFAGLSAEVKMRSDGYAFDGNAILTFFAREFRFRLGREGIEIEHLRFTLTPDTGSDVGVLKFVRGDARPELSKSLDADLEAGDLSLHLRAGDDPGILAGVLTEVFSAFAQGHSGIELLLVEQRPLSPNDP